MKKNLFMLLLLSSMYTGYAAEPTWDMDTYEGSLSYSTTLQGTYTYDSLGDANIKNGESFSITMKAICIENPYVHSNTSQSVFASKGDFEGDIYDLTNAGDNQLRLFVDDCGNSTRYNDSSDYFLHIYVNGETYGYYRYVKNWTKKLQITNFSFFNANRHNEDNPYIIGITFTYVNAKDSSDGVAYFTLASTEDSDIVFDVYTETDIKNTFNFSDLTNATVHTAVPDSQQLQMTVIKAMPEATTMSGSGAGAALINDAYVRLNPQLINKDSALAKVLVAQAMGSIKPETLAAVAGASTPVLGQALSGDTERQLRAIRNRSVSGSTGNDCVALDDKRGLASPPAPAHFFAWVNAEGNRAEQNNDGLEAGYSLNSWGATLGAGMEVTGKFSLGLALTAMKGELKSDGPDRLDGDMDTTYLSAFAHYNSGKWNHALVGTMGAMDTDYDRSVSHAYGSYTTQGDTDGSTYGFMYDVSRDYFLSNRSVLSPVFNVSYRHAEVDSYCENGSNAALTVDEQSLDTVTLGLGARYAALVGQQALNRACTFEARALAKYDFGDRQSATNVGLARFASRTRARVESGELGAFGVELGAGIAVPVGYGSVFADGTVELRSDYTNFNAAVGYKIQF